MAEAFLKYFAKERFSVFSAGISPGGVHPLTTLMMEEEGIQMSDQYSKGVDEIPLETFDFVITLCDHAKKLCPDSIQANIREHWPIQDPIAFAAGEGVRIAKFREAKEEIKKRVIDWLDRFDRT